MHPTTRDDYHRDGCGCSCHLNAPCGYCLAPWACPECGGPAQADAAFEHDRPHDDALVCEECRPWRYKTEINGHKIREVATHAETGTVLASTWWSVDDGSAGAELAEMVRKWSNANASADTGPEAATAPTLEALADIAGALETSPLAGGADLRAELRAERADLDTLKSLVANYKRENAEQAGLLSAARADHLADVNARAAEADDLRAKLQAMHRRAQAAEAERDTLAQHLSARDAQLRLALDDIAKVERDADYWRGIAEELSARPRLRDRVWRWFGGGR